MSHTTLITDFKRVKERLVGQAWEKVEQWRQMFEEGITDEFGNVHKLTLNKAAEKVGIPKKTLEDYTQIFKKLKLISNMELFMDKKMGALRTFLRKNQSKLRKALKIERLKEQQLSKQNITTQIVSECESHSTTDAQSCEYIYENESQEEFSQNEFSQDIWGHRVNAFGVKNQY